MSYGDPYTDFYDDRMTVSDADRAYYAARAPAPQNPWNMPTYTSMPEGRMQIEQSGFPAITGKMCGTCPRYENPQRPPMRKTPLSLRSDYALNNYPPDHDTVASSCTRCVSGFGGGCSSCSSGCMSTSASTGVIQRLEAMTPSPSSSITLTPMRMDITNFILVFIFIIVVFICISFSRAVADIRARLDRLAPSML